MGLKFWVGPLATALIAAQVSAWCDTSTNSEETCVTSITPTQGSLNGETRITLYGQNFAQSQFTFGAANAHLGNKVTLVSETRSYPCIIHPDGCHERQITCYTSPMEEDYYWVRVEIDGKVVPHDKHCGSRYHTNCRFLVTKNKTPAIYSLVQESGNPDDLLCATGRIFTDKYGTNVASSSNGNEAKILRSWVTGGLCELLKPDMIDEFWKLQLKSDTSNDGEFCCKPSTSYVSNWNASIILDGAYGRSATDSPIMKVSWRDRLHMYQSYAVISSVSPVEGSTAGGTKLTINGKFFDQTDEPLEVMVGGQPCTNVQLVSSTQITCSTPVEPAAKSLKGNRGMFVEMWNHTDVHKLTDDEISALTQTPVWSSLLDQSTWKHPVLDTDPVMNKFVSRQQFYFKVPKDSDYKFFLGSNDRGTLFISTDGNPANKVVAGTNTAANTEFDSTTAQTGRLSLTKGQLIYLEAVHIDQYGSAQVQVGVHMYESIYTNDYSHEAQNEIHQIDTTSTIKNEIQEIAFENLNSKNGVTEKQTISITSNTASASYFQLGFTDNGMNVWTAPLPLNNDLSNSMVANALNNLPFMVDSKKASVIYEDIAGGKKLEITFPENKGDFPAIKVRTVSGAVSASGLTETTKGQASGSNLQLKFGNAVSPVIDPTSLSSVKSGIEKMLTVRCPGYIGDKLQQSGYKQDFETNTLKSSGYRTYEVEPFCGRYSSKNPGSLLYIRNADNTWPSSGVRATSGSNFCFAFRGILKNDMYIRYLDDNGALTGLTINPFTAYTENPEVAEVVTDSNTAALETWRYRCIDLLTQMQAKRSYVTSAIQFLEIKVYKANGLQDLYIDAISMTPSAPTFNLADDAFSTDKNSFRENNLILYERLRPTQWLNDVLTVTAVSGVTNKYQVEIKILDCHSNLPHIELLNAQVATSGNKKTSTFPNLGNMAMVTEKTQAASPPVTGTFNLKFGTYSLNNVNAQVDETTLAGLIGQIDLEKFGITKVTRTGTCAAYKWLVEHTSVSGDKPNIQLASSNVNGAQAAVTVSTFQDGGVFWNPIYGDLISSGHHDKPQVTVSVNGMPSRCDSDCGFSWKTAKTPTLTASNPTSGSKPANTVLTLTGTDFSTDTANNIVTIAGVQCTTVTSTATQITCNIGEGPVGSYNIVVRVVGFGEAKHSGGTKNFEYDFSLTGVAPSAAGSVAGGFVATIQGTGFSKTSVVKVDNKECVKSSQTYASIVCIVPKGASTGAKAITIVDGSKTATNNAVTFTYEAASATITSLSDNVGAVEGGKDITITGTSFGAAQFASDAVSVGDKTATIKSWSDTSIVVTLPSQQPGRYNLLVKVSDKGYADGNKKIDYFLEVTNVYPVDISTKGGAKITITGKGFSANASLNDIKFGDVSCAVETVTNTQIVCKLGNFGSMIHITNQGWHQSFGIGFQWSPAAVTAEESDILHFKWTSSYGVNDGVGFRVAQTKNLTSAFDLTGSSTFSSGSVKTSNGEWSYQGVQQTTAPYYYWSGEINTNGDMSTWGKFTVVETKDRAKYLNFTVSGVEAEYKLGGSNPAGASCPNTASSCDTVITDANYESSLFKLQGRKCLTPTITGISPSVVPTAATNNVRHITITGTGFSTVSGCPNKVLIEKDTLPNVECGVVSATATSIVCEMPTTCTALPAGMPLSIDVVAGNKGLAVHKQKRKTARGFTVVPEVTAMAPFRGSLGGGTRVTITGRNFMSNTTAPCSAAVGRKRRSLLKDFELNGGNAVTTSLRLDFCSSLTVIDTSTLVCVTKPTASSFLISKLQLFVTTAAAGEVEAVCLSSLCSFYQLSALSAKITSITDSATGNDMSANGVITAEGQELHISGTNFGGLASTYTVLIGNSPCVINYVDFQNIRCNVQNLVHGTWTATLLKAATSPSDSGSGYAITSPLDKYVNVVKIQGSITPNSFGPVGTGGGVFLTINGVGFDPQAATVTIGGQECKINNTLSPSTNTKIVCETPAGTHGIQPLVVKVGTKTAATGTIDYSTPVTPTLVSVAPTQATSGDSVVITGTNYGTDISKVSVSVGDATCTVTAVTATTITCTLGDRPAGAFDIKMRHTDTGHALGAVQLSYALEITTVSPNTGSTGGGQDITLTGKGFDPKDTVITLCNNPCTINTTLTTTSNINCVTPAATALGQCDVVATISGGVTVTKSNGYNYNLSPTVTGVNPARGGTGGGTMVTITGTGFGSVNADVEVTIAGTICDIQGSVSPTQIICQTNAHKPSVKAKVEVRITTSGIAKQVSADFEYIDLWSSQFTWNYKPPPVAGDFVVIPADMKVLLDVNTPTFKILLIQGGTVVFENKASADITLNSEIILITDNGKLEVGTEAEPYVGKAKLQLHGHVRSKDLPIYGTKNIAVRNGELSLHGKPIAKPWTSLDGTVSAGATSITVLDDISNDWKAGDSIAIASTGHFHSQNENEERVITQVSGKTITFSPALAYGHLGEVKTYAGRTLQARAEVGLLSRNIVVRGSDDTSWHDKIEACPAGFNPGEFSTQTCFEGRFGDEMGSDQFGVQIIMHGDKPGAVRAQIENTEVTYSGQAFRLGRYSIHFHLNGDMLGSYVKNCAIHKSFNRAVNIHGTHNITLERNVAYNIMGGAFFLEDGIESDNIFQYNLAIFVKQSTSLQNDDITPAAYWITNANNKVRYNHAAGGTHFGFWYRIHEKPDEASFDPNVCPQRIPMPDSDGFKDNVVHSQGWFGVWIFMKFTPTECEEGGGCCKSTTPKAAIFDGLTSWNNEKGAESVGGGAIQFKNFFLVNNHLAGLEWKLVMKLVVSYDVARGTSVQGGMIVAYDATLPRKGEVNNYAIVLPQGHGFRVDGVTFYGYNRPLNAVLRTTDVQGTTSKFNGGYCYIFSGITLEQTTNIEAFKWLHDSCIIDSDGSLTGEAANSKIVPTMGTLPPTLCKQEAKYSLGETPGSVCQPSVEFHRFSFNHYAPSSLEHVNVTLTTEHGSATVGYAEKGTTHKLGWTALLLSKTVHDMTFDGHEQITNITFEGVVYDLKPDQWVIINHPFHHSPDRLTITGNVTDRVKKDQPVQFANAEYGDYSISQNVRNGVTYHDAKYLVSGKRLVGDEDDWSNHIHRPVNLEVYRCYYADCNPPADPNDTPVPQVRPSDYVLYHSTNIWAKHRTDAGISVAMKPSVQVPNVTIPIGNLPQEDTDVLVDSSTWVVMNQEVTLRLGSLYLYGGFELEYLVANTQALASGSGRKKRSTVQATAPVKMVLSFEKILVSGGRFFCGWPGKLMENEITIQLRGNTFAPDMPLPGGPNLGAKAFGVFGGLELHGQTPSHQWLRLQATANKGSSQITLTESPDWKAGNEIVIAGTSFSPYQTEKKTISAISGNDITLDTPLEYTHIGGTEEVATGVTVPVGAEVGLLTRTIKIEGMDYSINGQPGGMAKEGFGGRLLVGSYAVGQQQYVGYARMHNVQFKNMGQEGWSDFYDPRYAVAFLDVGTVDSTLKPSEVTGCSFDNSYNTAIGVFGTNELYVQKNVIYKTVGSSLIIWGQNNKVLGNVAMEQIYPGTWNGRTEERDTWQAAMELQKSEGLLLKDNSVSNYERAGYRVDGESCTSAPTWSNNVAHSGLEGVIMLPDQRDGVNPCSLLNGFIVSKNYDWGMYLETGYSLKLTNNIFMDNNVGLLPFIYGPSALAHMTADKFVNIEGGHFVGKTSSFDCATDKLLSTEPRNAVLLMYSPRGRSWRVKNEGMTGAAFGTFSQATNNAPLKPWSAMMAYQAINGITTMKDTTFKNYGQSCLPRERDYAISTAAFNDDASHPMYLTNVKSVGNVDELSKVFMNDPRISKINPSDCVDMDCDGLKQTMLKDITGNFLGSQGAVVIPKTEKFWDGDRKRGLGDYRVPKVLQTDVNGNRLDINKIAGQGQRGIFKDSSCQDVPEYNGWKCKTQDYEFLHLESMDFDTETRRVSPVAIQSGVTQAPSVECPTCYLDLVNGPQDHGWCMGYTCQKRLSLFPIMLPIGQTNHLVFSGTTPQGMRLHFPNAAASQASVVGIWYARPSRLDVSVAGIYIPPNNGQVDSQGRLSLTKPATDDQYMPKFTDQNGNNYFDRDNQFLYILLKGGSGDVVEITTSPQIVVNFAIPSMTVDQFFGPQIVSNLAAFFDIPQDKIRVAHAVRDNTATGRRKKRSSDILVTVTISNPPRNLAGLYPSDLTVGQLENITQQFINTYQLGQLGSQLNLNILSFQFIPPQVTVTISNPPRNLTGLYPSDLTVGQLENITQQFINTYQLGQLGSQLNLNILSFQIIQPLPQSGSEAWQVFATLGQNATVDVQVPTNITMVEELVPIHEGAAFSVQPSLQMVDAYSNAIAQLGSLLAPWKITANLVTVSSPWSSKTALVGTQTVSYNNSYFNFTNLAVSHAGTYRIDYIVSDPTTAAHFQISSKEFTIADRALGAGIVSQPANITEGTTFDVSVELIDAVTKQKVTDITWKGHTWSATISMYLPDTFSHGTLTGPTASVAVDTTTGIAVFTGLSINNQGRYFMAVHYVTSPADYDFVGGADQYIDVFATDYTLPVVEKLHHLKMRFNHSFEAIKGHEVHFAGALHNKLWTAYPNLIFSNYTVYNGSIIVEFDVAGSHSDLRAMLKNHWNKVQKGAFSLDFNATAYQSDTVMWVNGDKYGGEEGHRLPLFVIILIALLGGSLLCLIVGFFVYKYYRSKMSQKHFELDKREPTMKRRGLTNMGQDDYYHVPEDQGSSSSLSSGGRHGDEDKLVMSQAPKSTHFDFVNVRPRTSYKAPNLLPPLEQTPKPVVFSSTASESSRPTSTTYLNLQVDHLSPPQ